MQSPGKINILNAIKQNDFKQSPDEEDDELEDALTQQKMREYEAREACLMDSLEPDPERVFFEETTIDNLKKDLCTCWTEALQRGHADVVHIRQALAQNATVQSPTTWHRLDDFYHCKLAELDDVDDDQGVDLSNELKPLVIVGACVATVVASHSHDQALLLIARSRGLMITDEDPALLKVFADLILDIVAKGGCDDYHWGWIVKDTALKALIAPKEALHDSAVVSSDRSPAPVAQPMTPPALSESVSILLISLRLRSRLFTVSALRLHDNPLGLPAGIPSNTPQAPRIPRRQGPIEPRKIPHVKYVVLVSSCKGGVGKSTIAVNLALSLSHLRLKVGLLDLDIFGPSIPTLMGLTRAPEPELTPRGALRPLVNHGIPTMSMGYLLPPLKPVQALENEDEVDHEGTQDTPVVWRGLMVQKAVQQLLFQTDWSGNTYGADGTTNGGGAGLDVLVIDLPPGTGDIPLSVGQLVKVDSTLIISTPQDVALSDVRRGVSMFRKLNVPMTGLVLNQAYFIVPLENHSGVSEPCPHCTDPTCPVCAPLRVQSASSASSSSSNTSPTSANPSPSMKSKPINTTPTGKGTGKKYHLFGPPAPFHAAAARMRLPVLGELPLVPGVSSSGDRGVPYALSSGQARIAGEAGEGEWRDAMRGVAERVWGSLVGAGKEVGKGMEKEGK